MTSQPPGGAGYLPTRYTRLRLVDWRDEIERYLDVAPDAPALEIAEHIRRAAIVGRRRHTAANPPVEHGLFGTAPHRHYPHAVYRLAHEIADAFHLDHPEKR